MKTMVTKRTWHTVVSALSACIVLYFLYHTIEGERGWLSMLRLQQQVNESQANLESLQKDRAQLEHRVQLMRPNSLDPDLLDEKSRELLNYSKPGDIVVLTAPDKSGNNNGVLQRSKTTP